MTAVVEESPGFEIASGAMSGEKALDLAATLQFDLVLLDLTLPGIRGLETTRGLRTLEPALVVLLMSTHDEEAGESFVAESGAADLRHQGGDRTGPAGRTGLSDTVERVEPPRTLLQGQVVGSGGAVRAASVGGGVDLLLQPFSDDGVDADA